MAPPPAPGATPAGPPPGGPPPRKPKPRPPPGRFGRSPEHAFCAAWNAGLSRLGPPAPRWMRMPGPLALFVSTSSGTPCSRMHFANLRTASWRATRSAGARFAPPAFGAYFLHAVRATSNACRFPRRPPSLNGWPAVGVCTLTPCSRRHLANWMNCGSRLFPATAVDAVVVVPLPPHAASRRLAATVADAASGARERWDMVLLYKYAVVSSATAGSSRGERDVHQATCP